MIEWECTLACNYNCTYCTNGRNAVLKQPIKAVTDLNILSDFIQNVLKPEVSSQKLFLFGGEPTLHPKIIDIVQMLKDNNINFVMQTNFSDPELVKQLNCPTRVSVHKQLNIEYYKYLADISQLESVDVMYDSSEALRRYFLAKKYFSNATLVPVCDFDGTNKHLNALKMFNRIKKMKLFNCEEGQRSFVWQKMVEGTYTTIGHTCMYKNKYVLFDPSLHRWSCSHRMSVNTCRWNCFLM